MSGCVTGSSCNPRLTLVETGENFSAGPYYYFHILQLNHKKDLHDKLDQSGSGFGPVSCKSNAPLLRGKEQRQNIIFKAQKHVRKQKLQLRAKARKLHKLDAFDAGARKDLSGEQQQQ